MAFDSIWNAVDGLVCLELDAAPSGLDVCFPGGFCLSHVWQGINNIPRGADLPLQFFGQIGPAMAFLSPLFSVLDTVLAIYKCVVAIPDSILQLDPAGLFECMPALVELINQLISMVPQMSLPRMVRQILVGLAQLLQGVASDFQFLIAQFQRVLDAIDNAADLNDSTLNDFLTCRQNTLSNQALNTVEALGGVGKIILLANIFIGLFGGDTEIPCFGDVVDLTALDGTVDILLELAEYLLQLAALIPDPQYVISLALQNQEC